MADRLAPGVQGDDHAPLHAVQLLLILVLDPREAGVFHANVAEHLRRKLALGIKTLMLRLKVDATQVEGTNA